MHFEIVETLFDQIVFRVAVESKVMIIGFLSHELQEGLLVSGKEKMIYGKWLL